MGPPAQVGMSIWACRASATEGAAHIYSYTMIICVTLYDEPQSNSHPFIHESLLLYTCIVTLPSCVANNLTKQNNRPMALSVSSGLAILVQLLAFACKLNSCFCFIVNEAKPCKIKQ